MLDNMSSTSIERPTVHVARQPRPGKDHPYSVAIRNGADVTISGRLGVDDGGDIVPGGFRSECVQALQNVDAALRLVGGQRSDVRHVTAYLVHAEDRAVLNELYGDFFSDPRPTRTCIGVSWLPYNGLVEIEVLATVHDPQPTP
jgi:enamine deaminase RidA (YjgF/YER057c/UK114 family)